MKSVLEMALEALEYHREQTRAIPKSDAAIAALKEALKKACPNGDCTAGEYCEDCGYTVSYWRT